MTLSYDHYLEFQMSSGPHIPIPQGQDQQGQGQGVSNNDVVVNVNNVSKQFEIFVVC
jgi:hypothetical protein